MDHARRVATSRSVRTTAAVFAVVVLLAVGMVIVRRILTAQADGIAVVNVSGRQRTLSQRIASFALQAAHESDPGRRSQQLAQLRVSIEVMRDSLDALATGGPVPALDGSPSGISLDGHLSPALMGHYYGAPTRLDAQVRRFLSDARAVAADLEAGRADPARLEALVSDADGPLLDVLNRAVMLRQRQQTDTLEHLQLVSIAALGSVAVALGLLARARARRRLGDASAEAERKAAERFQFLVQDSFDIFVVMEADTTIRYVSPAAERVFGYAEGALVGVPALCLLHPDDLARSGPELTALLALEGAQPRATVWRVRRADGSWAEAEIKASNHLDDVRVAGIVLNVRDVSENRAVERAREAEHAFVEAVVDTVPTLVVVLNPAGELVRMNRAAESLTGYTQEEVAGRSARMFLADEEAEEVQAVLVGLHNGEFPNTHENHWITRAGDRRLISWTNTCLLDEEGRVAYMVGTGLDVTATRRTEQERRQADERFRVVFDHAPVGLALLAPDGRLLSVNQPLCELVGQPQDTLLGLTLPSLVAADGGDDLHRALAALPSRHDSRQAFEVRLTRPDGTTGWFALGLTLVRDDGGEPLHFVAQLEDITSRHDAEVELQRRALYDDLTGLPNRTLLLDRLARATARLARSEAKLAVLYLDLDGFKAVNDNLGHAAGDEVLQATADRLRTAVRPSDTVARLGGDEFVMLCEDLVDERHAAVVAARLRDELRPPLAVAGTTVTVGASIGIAFAAGPHEPNGDDLLARADAAMYDAKGRSRRSASHGSAAGAGAPVPADERARLEALRSYGVLDTPPEEVYDDLVRLAAMVCETPIAAISLVDGDRLWLKASVGLAVREVPRDVAFCAHAIVERDLLVVDDTLADERFRDNPLVTADPGIRFYSGAPLRNADDHALGSLCVFDTVPRRLRPDQEAALRALARQVMHHLEQRRREGSSGEAPGSTVRTRR